MRLYTLTFPTERQMRSFIDTLSAPFIEINIRTLTLICQCTEKELEEAITNYGAELNDESIKPSLPKN